VYTRGMSTATKPETAIIYVRVSSARQALEGLSLEAQERTLRASAEGAGYEVSLFTDSGKSGKSLSGRQGLRLALEELNAGRASALYVARLDRLARSVSDLLGIVDQAIKNNWRLVLMDLGVDTATPHGRLVLSMLGSVAEFERGLISERQKDVHAERRSRGEVWGVTKGNLPETSQEVRALVLDLSNKGLSLRAICKELTMRQIPTTRGGLAWYPSTVRALLNSPSMSLEKTA
jgi:DNA invertase Pin-like site-specific DNA recombinase